MGGARDGLGAHPVGRLDTVHGAAERGRQCVSHAADTRPEV
jgi:hypothetical protein